MKTLLLFLVYTLLTAITANAQDAETNSPDVIVKQVVDKVISSLKSDKDLIHSHQKLEEFVETKLLYLFDFAYMARQTIGEKRWESASTQEQSDLVDEYRAFMANIFTNALSQYEDQSVIFPPFTMSTDTTIAIVKSKLIDPTDETEGFNFKLDRTSDGWKIYDVELGGIDLIRTYKSNFSSTLQHGGIQKLIGDLHRKNVEVKMAKSG